MGIWDPYGADEITADDPAVTITTRSEWERLNAEAEARETQDDVVTEFEAADDLGGASSPSAFLSEWWGPLLFLGALVFAAATRQGG